MPKEDESNNTTTIEPINLTWRFASDIIVSRQSQFNPFITAALLLHAFKHKQQLPHSCDVSVVGSNGFKGRFKLTSDE